MLVLKKILKCIGTGLIIYPIGFLYILLNGESINKAWWLTIIFDLIAIIIALLADYFGERKNKKQPKKKF